MALTIAVASLKGGVGKSTIALNLAACLHRAGHRALVVDTDSQGTCLAWAAVAADNGRSGAPVVGLVGRGLRRDLEQVASGFDVVVIDAPPRLGPEARAAMLAADIVLMPTTPGAADVWALRATLEVLAEAREVRPELRAAVVLNRADRTTLASLTGAAVAELGVEVLAATLGARVAFGEATLAGLGVVDYAPGSPAAREVEELTAAVLAAVRGRADDEGKQGKRKGRSRAGVLAAGPAAPDSGGQRPGRALRGDAGTRPASKPPLEPPPQPSPQPSPIGAATSPLEPPPALVGPVGARTAPAGRSRVAAQPAGGAKAGRARKR